LAGAIGEKADAMSLRTENNEAAEIAAKSSTKPVRSDTPIGVTRREPREKKLPVEMNYRGRWSTEQKNSKKPNQKAGERGKGDQC